MKVGKYTLTTHAQNRIVEKNRHMNKFDVLDNLFTRPNGITKIVTKKDKPAYKRVGKRITTVINPINNNVTTCIPISRQDKKEFNLINISKNRRRKKYVKRNSNK